MRFLTVTLIICFLASCSNRTGHKVEYSEIDGVRLVRTTGAPKYDSPLFELERDLVLGIDEGEPEWQIFGRRPIPLIAPDNRLILDDSRRLEIFIVSPEGELLRRLGGQGAGPGEFMDIWSVHWADIGSEFWVEDRQLFRITRYSAAGDFLGTFNYSKQYMEWMTYQTLGDYRFLGEAREQTDDGRYRMGFLDSLLFWERDFMAFNPLPSFRVTETSGYPIPYSAGDGVSACPDGRLLLEFPNDGRLTICSTEGNPILHIQRDWEFLPVTAQEKEDLRRSWRESSNDRYRRMAEIVPFPQNRPAFRNAFMDNLRRIWVERYKGPYYSSSAESYTYDVFGPEGVWLGVQDLPFRMSISGNYAYRSYLAESGGPRLERYRLRPLYPEAVRIRD